MRKLLQINVIVNSGSTGHIAEEIGRLAMANGWKSYIAYGRWACTSQSELIRIGNQIQILFHVAQSLIGDRHGQGSARATRKLVAKIREIRPDIIHLHNIHGYYLNYKILFEFLVHTDIPVVWTLHDCWSMTGHCSHFQPIGCDRWKQGCFECPNLRNYPRSLFRDNSKNNYRWKKSLFPSVKNLTIVPVCGWLEKIVEKSFLKDLKRKVIVNGINLDVFHPTAGQDEIRQTFRLTDCYLLLAVATVWNADKGLHDILSLRSLLSARYVIVMIGLTRKQIKHLPAGIIGLKRTENARQLARWYSAADVFINPTYQDTLPTVDIEALACGTPVATYDTGGSADILSEDTGVLVKCGDTFGLFTAVTHITEKGKSFYTKACRRRAEKYFNKQERFRDYLRLYDQLL